MHLENQDLDSHDNGAEKLAAEAASQLQLLIGVLDSISDQVFLVDASGQITLANKAFLRTFNLSASEVIGKRPTDILPAEMASACEVAGREVFERGEPIRLETHWQDRDSAGQRWTETNKFPMRDSSGKIAGLVCISRDITGRRFAEEELKRQKTLLEQVVETVPDQLFVKDRLRQIIVANQAFFNLIHRYSDQGVGQDPSPALPPEVIEASMKTDTLVLEEGRPVSGEVTYTDLEGAERCFEVRKLPLMEDGEIAGIVGLCRDLTEVKKAERQSKRNETLLLHATRLSSLGQLAASIVHEVNQPLFSILNYAKAIENKLLDEEELDLAAIRKWIQQIKREADHGGKITQRLKSFVKPAESQREPVEINKLVSESIEFLAMEAQDAGVVIKTDLLDGLPEVVVDRIQILQVLVNLLKNALEAHRENSTTDPRVIVSTLGTAQQVEVSVADNGPGVSVTEGVNILDPFQTTKHDGIGLGLAISNTIVEAHQGQLTYHPNDWGGVTFSFTLNL